MADTSARLKLPYLQPAQAQKHVTHNEAILLLDALVQTGIAAFDADTPPASPEEGAAYDVGGSASGAWAGHAGEVVPENWTVG